jgi:hypothetical protein
MRLASLLAALTVWTLPVAASAAQPVDSFLPQDQKVDATCVVIEQDPAFEAFKWKMVEYMERDREWYQAYAREHQTDWEARIPWHERFGVSREDYEHFTEPMNHFREVSRQEIGMRLERSASTLRIEFEGEDLLLESIDLDLENETAATPNDVLPMRAFLELERASLPPGAHRGVHFRTPDEKQRQTHVRESLLIGEVRELDVGIIHFEVWTEEGRSRIYITFPR